MPGGGTLNREETAMLFVLLDSFQMIIVMLFVLVMKGLLRREVNATEQLLIEAQDFTVNITGLPKLA